VNTYHLYFKINGNWEWQCNIYSERHANAFEKALKYLYSAHCHKPIRLEQIDSKPDDPILNKG
jgi:hypothetical protein